MRGETTEGNRGLLTLERRVLIAEAAPPGRSRETDTGNVIGMMPHLRPHQVAVTAEACRGDGDCASVPRCARVLKA